MAFAPPSAGVTATGLACVSSAGNLVSIVMSNPGSGYTTAPAVTFSGGGGGSGAAAIAKVDPNTGAVTGAVVSNAGSGYTVPTVTLGGNGSGATAAAAVTSTGTIGAVVVTNGGTGYTSGPMGCTIRSGGIGCTAHISAVSGGGNPSTIVVDNGGSGYIANSTLAISATIGNSATFTPTVVNGVITAITASGGSSYTTSSIMTILQGYPGNFGGVITPAGITTSAGGVTAISVYGAGQLYKKAPTLFIYEEGNSGSGATATANLTTGAISSVTVTAAGTGYTPPVATITQGGGSGCTLTASNYCAKLQTFGLGPLEIDHLTISDLGSVNSTPFLLSTGTTLTLHDTEFVGTGSAGGNNTQDCLLIGGTEGAFQVVNDPNASFQGYDCWITHNWFEGIRRAVWSRTYVQEFHFNDNCIQICGTNNYRGDNTSAPIECDERATTGSWGGTLAGTVCFNHIQLANYNFAGSFFSCDDLLWLSNSMEDFTGTTVPGNTGFVFLDTDTEYGYAQMLNDGQGGHGGSISGYQDVVDDSGLNCWVEPGNNGIQNLYPAASLINLMGNNFAFTQGGALGVAYSMISANDPTNARHLWLNAEGIPTITGPGIDIGPTSVTINQPLLMNTYLYDNTGNGMAFRNASGLAFEMYATANISYEPLDLYDPVNAHTLKLVVPTLSGAVNQTLQNTSDTFVYLSTTDTLTNKTLTTPILSSGTPASSGASGVTGTIEWDASYIYICTATNTWKRVAISTW